MLFAPANVVPFESSYTLGKKVSAIQILPPGEDGIRRLGLITQLPEGAEVNVGGPGFNDRTVKVSWEGSSYFIFLEDLDTVKKRVASTAIG
ncbi:MAG: hypothetical protein JO033_13855 [Acidobacteriaceae bacterium]|nr:hypothetical protein [Acidobacteriaceae bacterium]MBV9498094.1 hypothetical protein [Acidobacteriaceae bacterium]